MSIKIFHTGDLHIGMKFANYPENIKRPLVEARFETLEKMVKEAHNLGADLFVVAGDLFNSIKINKSDLKRTADILSKFEGNLVAVLPGNHDYDNEGVDLWKDFMGFARDNVILLNEERPYSLKDYDLDLMIYPGPCHSKHSASNSIGWIKNLELKDDHKYKVGIAHGAIEGLSPDLEGNYYYMSFNELESLPLNVWLLGHTHVAYPSQDKVVNHRIFNAGTHEPDGMNFLREGAAWLIELEDQDIKAERIVVGKYMFLDKKYTVNSRADLERIERDLVTSNAKSTLVRISLEGSLEKEIYEELNDYYKSLTDKLLYLAIEDSKLNLRITMEIIEKEYEKGSFPFEFLRKLEGDQEALQLAYDLVRGGTNAH